MKTKFFLFILALALSYTASAQFPNFIKVDTGAITIMPGGHGSSTCFDIDNDGDMDIATMNSGTYINRNFSIYKNERNGLFIKIPDFISIDNSRNLSSFGDVDNDGDIDLFTGLPSNKIHYFVNDGYGNYHYDTTIFLNTTTYYPSLIDLNNDGFLDIVGIDRMGGVVYNDGGEGFLHCTSLGGFQEQQDVLLHGMSWGDVDDDGDLDFFGGYSPNTDNAIPKNLCYLNNGNGEFVEFDPSSIIVEGECRTTCANWVDYDNDGDMDLYVHNVICDNMLPALYENLGDMQFTRHDIVDEKYRYSLAGSAVWGDLDNDADLDLYISIENNPFPWPPPDTSATPYNVLYLNDGNGQFTEFLDEQHPLVNEDTHTAMLLDYDNDGDLDVLLTRYGWINTGHDNLFVNEGNDNSWIVLTCVGTESNKSAIGTRVQAKCFVNGNHITQTREITPINGHLSYANLRVHFGFGDTDIIDTLIIRWPSGYIDKYTDVQTNHFYKAVENTWLVIDSIATNYNEYSPHIANMDLDIYPNPNSGELHLRYSISDPSTSLGTGSQYSIFEVYSIQGVKLRTLMEQVQQPGEYELTFDISDLPSGMYFVRFQLGEVVETRKVILIN